MLAKRNQMATNAYTALLLDELHEQLDEHITDDARELIADNADVHDLTSSIYDLAVSAIASGSLTPLQALYSIDAANVALSIATSAQFIAEQNGIEPDVVLEQVMSTIEEG